MGLFNRAKKTSELNSSYSHFEALLDIDSIGISISNLVNAIISTTLKKELSLL